MGQGWVGGVGVGGWVWWGGAKWKVDEMEWGEMGWQRMARDGCGGGSAEVGCGWGGVDGGGSEEGWWWERGGGG